MEASEQLKQVDLSSIEISGANPRKDVKGESFKDLKASIAEHGIIEPLLVRPKGKGYELVAGERRFTAAKELKLEKVPVAIRDLDDRSARVLMLLENLQREDLEPLEEAAAIEELLKPGQTTVDGKAVMTQEDLAQKLGKSQPWIANRLRLMKAPKELKAMLTKGEITPQHVMEVLPFAEYKVYSERILPDIRDSLKRGPMTVEDLKREIQRGLGDGETTLSLLSFTYDTMDYKPYFDTTGCDTCKDKLETGSRRNMDKDHICLNRTCWSDRLNRAKQEHDKTAKQEEEEYRKELEKKLGKKVRSTSVDTSRLDYSSYTYITSGDFDKSECKKGCEFYKVAKGRNATLYGEKDPQHVCLKPSCYRGKKAQASRFRNKAVREELSFVDKSLESYLSARKPGFSLKELKYVCERIADIAPHSYGRGKDLADAIETVKKGSAAELETSILRVLAKEQLGPVRFNLDKGQLKDIEGDLPFEVSREKAEKVPVPNCKKVQEKRGRRKGAPA